MRDGNSDDQEESRKEKWALAVQHAYSVEMEKYVDAKWDFPEFDFLLKILEFEWRKVVENPDRVKRDADGNPLAKILEKDGRPYFDLLPA